MPKNESKKAPKTAGGKTKKKNLGLITVILLAVAFIISYFSVLSAITPATAEPIDEVVSLWGLDVGLFIYLAVGFATFGIYMWQMCRETFFDTRKMIILMILISITALLSLLCVIVDARMSPALFAVLLCAILVSERGALALSFLLAFIVCPMAGDGGVVAFEGGVFMLFLQTATSGLAATFALKRTQNRGVLIAAGAIGGVFAVFSYAALMIAAQNTALDILVATGWIMG